MFLIKTKLAPSPIHGIGVFADQDIKKGERIWIRDSYLDIDIPVDAQLPDIAREFLNVYAYRRGNFFRLCCDNCRFVNHSPTPNVTLVCGNYHEYDYAARDISRGEELTVNYTILEPGIII